jgi:nitrite reductase/ring-hydroxylating ferredoxin subunit
MAPIVNPWIYAGRGSSFQEIYLGDGSDDASQLAPKELTGGSRSEAAEIETTLPCTILQLASATSFTAQEVSAPAAEATLNTHPQVLVFRYRGKLHAIDHACPHSAFPLSKGALHDIEDFGVVLSTGIICPKHGWEFDLFTGHSDRGGYKLNVWEVDVRSGENGFGEFEEEVWVRRKEKRRFG